MAHRVAQSPHTARFPWSSSSIVARQSTSDLRRECSALLWGSRGRGFESRQPDPLTCGNTPKSGIPELPVWRIVWRIAPNVANLPPCHDPRSAPPRHATSEKCPGSRITPAGDTGSRHPSGAGRTAGASCGSSTAPTPRPSRLSPSSATSSIAPSRSTPPTRSLDSAGATSRTELDSAAPGTISTRWGANATCSPRPPSGPVRPISSPPRISARSTPGSIRDGLGASGIRAWHALISGSLSAAVRWGELDRNVARVGDLAPAAPAPRHRPRARARPAVSRRGRGCESDSRGPAPPRRSHGGAPGRALRAEMVRSRRRARDAHGRAARSRPAGRPFHRG